jgi:hypothetical protein
MGPNSPFDPDLVTALFPQTPRDRVITTTLRQPFSRYPMKRGCVNKASPIIQSNTLQGLYAPESASSRTV